MNNLYNIKQAHNSILDIFELFRIELASRCGKKVYFYDSLKMKNSTYEQFFGMELEEEDFVFVVYVNIYTEEIEFDIDDLEFFNSYEFDLVKETLEVLFNENDL